MKKKIFFVFILGLLLGVRAFAQCVVSGGDLTEDLWYPNYEDMQKNKKNIKKAAKKDGTSFNIIIAENTNLRSISYIKKISNEVFDGSEVNLDDYSNQSFRYSKDVTLVITRKKSKYYLTEIKDLMPKSEVDKKVEEENQKKREKEAAMAEEREEIINKINIIKEESEKSFREKEILRCKELGYKEDSFDSAAEKFAENKKFILGFEAYYEKNLLANQELQDFNIKVQNMFQTTKKVYTKWDNNLAKIQPSYADYKFDNMLWNLDKGNPWTYEYDDSSRYEDYKILIKQCEQYFLDNPIFSVHYLDLKKSSENAEDNTFVYVCDFEIDGFNFYQQIVNNISLGLKKAWKATWTEIPKDWIKTTPVGFMDYEIKCNIVDKNGKVLVEGNRTLIATTKYNQHIYMGNGGILVYQFNKSYEFKEVPSNVATLIEDGKAFVRLDSLYVNYGLSAKKKEVQIPKNKVSEYNRTKVWNKAKGEFENTDVKL